MSSPHANHQGEPGDTGTGGSGRVASPPGSCPSGGTPNGFPSQATAIPSRGPLERVRHLKRGTEYEVLGEAEVQVSTRCTAPDGPGNGVWPNSTIIREARPGYYAGDLLVVYRDVVTGKLWCRLPDEFRDGRFETIASAPTPPDRVGEEVEFVGMDARAGEPQDDPDAGLTHWQIAEEIGAIAKDGRGIKATVYAAIERAWLRGFEAGGRGAPSPEAGAGGDLGELERLREALRFYADRDAWTSLSNEPWQLDFESPGRDGHGYEVAEAALARSGKLVASTGSEEEMKGEPSGTGYSSETTPSVEARDD